MGFFHFRSFSDSTFALAVSHIGLLVSQLAELIADLAGFAEIALGNRLLLLEYQRFNLLMELVQAKVKSWELRYRCRALPHCCMFSSRNRVSRQCVPKQSFGTSVQGYARRLGGAVMVGNPREQETMPGDSPASLIEAEGGQERP